MTMRADVQMSSPYHSSLALNRGGLPEGLSCHHSNPIRYIFRGASHPVNSATAARPRRDWQEHARYSTYTQLCDLVSQLTFPGEVRPSVVRVPKAYTESRGFLAVTSTRLVIFWLIIYSFPCNEYPKFFPTNLCIIFQLDLNERNIDEQL